MSGFQFQDPRHYRNQSSDYQREASHSYPSYYQQDYPDFNRPSYPPSQPPTPLRHPRRFPTVDLVTAIRGLSLIATGGAVAAGALLLVGAWHSSSNFFGYVSSLVNQPQPEPKVDMRSTVVQQIRNASELTTAVYAMETVVPTKRDRTIGGYVIGTTTLLYIAYGEVRAGVDLSTLQASDLQITGDQLSLRLPPPKILDSKIDVTRSRVYDYDRGFLGLGPDAASELQDLAQRKTLERIVSGACTGGLLQTASDRAKLVISQLLTTSGYKSISVETQPPLPGTCPVVDPTLGEPANPMPPQAVPSTEPNAVPPGASSGEPSVGTSTLPPDGLIPPPPTTASY